MRIRKKILDDLSKKIDNLESNVSEQEKEKLGKEEKEKLHRFDLYHVIRLEKYVRQGGDPTLGTSFKNELTSEEFSYHLSHNLIDFAPSERWKQRKEAYYFHPSYIKMEKLNDWKQRAEAKYCTGNKCIVECPYYDEYGEINDDQVVKEWIEDVDIVEIDEYRKELGDEFVDSILNENN